MSLGCCKAASGRAAAAIGASGARDAQRRKVVSLAAAAESLRCKRANAHRVAFPTFQLVLFAPHFLLTGASASDALASPFFLWRRARLAAERGDALPSAAIAASRIVLRCTGAADAELATLSAPKLERPVAASGPAPQAFARCANSISAARDTCSRRRLLGNRLRARLQRHSFGRRQRVRRRVFVSFQANLVVDSLQYHILRR